MAGENQTKGNRTPFEAYSGDNDQYMAILQRVKGLPYGKRKRFEQQALEADFTSRHLNDTRYISLAAKDYLATLGCKVQVGNGKLTSLLRTKWKLNPILNPQGDLRAKNRSDHRHHCVDAFVIAMTSPALLQMISKLSRQLGNKELSAADFELPAPWPGFLPMLEEMVAQVVVSHSPTRKIAGALHEETAYGYIEEEGKFVYRVPVESLSPAKLAQVRDKAVRGILDQKLQSASGNIKEAFATPVFHHDGKTRIKKVRVNAAKLSKGSVFSVARDGKPYKHYKTGSNHHFEIYEDQNGKWSCEIITTLEAARRARIQRTKLVSQSSDGKNLVFSLCKNDCIEIPSGETKGIYRVQQFTTTNNGRLILMRSELGAIDGDDGLLRKGINPLKKLNIRKVAVDPLGRVFPAND